MHRMYGMKRAQGCAGALCTGCTVWSGRKDAQERYVQDVWYEAGARMRRSVMYRMYGMKRAQGCAGALCTGSTV